MIQIFIQLCSVTFFPPKDCQIWKSPVLMNIAYYIYIWFWSRMNVFIIYSSWLLNYISHHVQESFVSETTSSCSQRTRAPNKHRNHLWIREKFYNTKLWKHKVKISKKGSHDARIIWLFEQSYFGKSLSLSGDKISIYWKWHELWHLQNLPGNLCCYKQLNFRTLLCLKQSFVKLALDCT